MPYGTSRIRVGRPRLLVVGVAVLILGLALGAVARSGRTDPGGEAPSTMPLTTTTIGPMPTIPPAVLDTATCRADVNVLIEPDPVIRGETATLTVVLDRSRWVGGPSSRCDVEIVIDDRDGLDFPTESFEVDLATEPFSVPARASSVGTAAVSVMVRTLQACERSCIGDNPHVVLTQVDVVASPAVAEAREAMRRAVEAADLTVRPHLAIPVGSRASLDSVLRLALADVAEAVTDLELVVKDDGGQVLFQGPVTSRDRVDGTDVLLPAAPSTLRDSTGVVSLTLTGRIDGNEVMVSSNVDYVFRVEQPNAVRRVRDSSLEIFAYVIAAVGALMAIRSLRRTRVPMAEPSAVALTVSSEDGADPGAQEGS